MSTTYITRNSMTLAGAMRRLKEAGCTVEEHEDRRAVAIDPSGNYLHLTDDIGDYVTLSIDLEAGEMSVGPTEIRDGTPRVMAERYGINDADWMTAILDTVSEHEDEYDEIMGRGVAATDAAPE
jgi:hypothetical protein